MDRIRIPHPMMLPIWFSSRTTAINSIRYCLFKGRTVVLNLFACLLTKRDDDSKRFRWSSSMKKQMLSFRWILPQFQGRLANTQSGYSLLWDAQTSHSSVAKVLVIRTRSNSSVEVSTPKDSRKQKRIANIQVRIFLGMHSS
jgi:hypothetical protein